MTEATRDPAARTLGQAIELDYDMHPAHECADGVTLYVRHGRISAIVAHADGSNAIVHFYQAGIGGVRWWFGSGQYATARQRRALDAIAHAIVDVHVEIGATAHHLMLIGAGSLPWVTRRMLARRLGLDAARVRGTVKFVQGINVSRTWLDAVTMPGAKVRYFVDGLERRA